MLIAFEEFDVGTQVFEQFSGVRFPTTPRIFEPELGTASGSKAIINRDPGDEFPGPLRVEFSVPQSEIVLMTGLANLSVSKVPATLRAFDAANNEVAIDGPVELGPGPTPIRTFMRVSAATAVITSIELSFIGGFPVTLDNLEFDVEGTPAEPDVSAPVVSIIQPEEGAQLTGSMFLFEASIEEDRKLRL